MMLFLMQYVCERFSISMLFNSEYPCVGSLFSISELAPIQSPPSPLSFHRLPQTCSTCSSSFSHYPLVLHHFGNSNSLVNISVEHLSDQVDACLREGNEGHAKSVVKDLFDVVERVLFVDNGVQQDTQSPYILLSSTVRLSLEDFRGSII